MKLNLHPSKVIDFLYPLYAESFVFDEYSTLQSFIQEDFDLTPEQWQVISDHYFIIHDKIIDYGIRG